MSATTITADQFADDYYSSLQALTFNSRPIIESHTALAQENSQFASAIVSAIERRIEKAIPSQKLFALYLLDSISKNIGVPYTTLFSHNLFKTFTQTYGLVDDPTRCRLIKLFKTWKVPTAITGLPLFDINQLDKIETFLIKVTNPSNNDFSNANNVNSINNNSLNNNTINNNSNDLNIDNNNNNNIINNLSTQRAPLIASKRNLIIEVNELILMVNTRLQASPNDEKGQQRFKLLNQLKTIIGSNSSIPQTQLDEVAKQLQSIRDDEIMKLNNLKLQQQKELFKQQQQQQQKDVPFSVSQLQNFMNMGTNGNNSGNGNGNGNGMPTNNNNNNVLFNMMNSVMANNKTESPVVKSPPSMNTPPPSTNPLGLKNIAFLENILKKSANGNNTTTNNSINTSINNFTNSNNNKIDFKFIKPTKESILEDFILSQSFINNHVLTSNEISLLYNFKPIQCDKCNKRFSDNNEGTILKKNHDEWHQRVEQRMKIGGSGLGGVVNRSWYLNEKDWIEFDYDLDEKETNNNINNNNVNNNHLYNNNVSAMNNNNGSNNLTKLKDGNVIAHTSLKITSNGTNDKKDREDRNDNKIDLSEAPKHIVRIPESSNNEVICKICREMQIGIFDEDEGEWIWKNAIDINGTVYHWSCWMEAKMRNNKRDRSPQR